MGSYDAHASRAAKEWQRHSKELQKVVRARSKDVGAAIKRIESSKTLKRDDKILGLLEVFLNETRGMHDSGWDDSDARRMGAILFYDVEKHIKQDELFWGLWHFYHNKVEYNAVDDCFRRQKAAFKRYTRMDRDAEYIENANRRFYRNAGRIKWNNGDWAVVKRDSDWSRKWKLHRKQRLLGEARHQQHMDFLSQYQDDDIITLYRGFWVAKEQSVRKGRYKTGNEFAEQQDAGKGFTYTLDRNIASYFANNNLITGGAKDGSFKGRKGVVGTYEVERKNIKAIFFNDGEDEVVATNNDVRLIRYDLLNYGVSIHDSEVERLGAYGNEKYMLARLWELGQTGQLDVLEKDVQRSKKELERIEESKALKKKKAKALRKKKRKSRKKN